MGQIQSCSSSGAMLCVACANGDVQAAQEILKKAPKAAVWSNFKDRTSPLIQSAARGNFDVLQLVLETAVMAEGPEKAKKLCIDHANVKKQTALMVACKHGHPDCVEYLVMNGADPLLTDERRHNTCLHFAALYGHSECAHKLLGCRTSYRSQGRQLTVAQIPCREGSTEPNVKFIDIHNGWGLTALHIAVFQGSVNTVRALLRHGASLDAVIRPPRVENSPIRCAVGSNALHIAALIGNVVMAKVILESQEAFPGLELRARTDSAGMRPQEYAQRARNPMLVHLLDERLPVHLLRQVWVNYSLEQSMPPRHQTLAAMLQKLKLMFNLEVIAAQRNLAAIKGAPGADASQQQQQQEAAAAAEGAAQPEQQQRPACATSPSCTTPCRGGASTPATAAPISPQSAAVRQLWSKRLDDVQLLLNSVDHLHSTLTGLCNRDAPEPLPPSPWPNPRASNSHEAVLDFILSTLITPRTVSSVLHAAKKLVCSTVMAPEAGGPPEAPPVSDVEVQHSMALLMTALRAVESCLHAAGYLTNPAALEAAGGMVPPLPSSVLGPLPLTSPAALSVSPVAAAAAGAANASPTTPTASAAAAAPAAAAPAAAAPAPAAVAPAAGDAGAAAAPAAVPTSPPPPAAAAAGATPAATATPPGAPVPPASLTISATTAASAAMAAAAAAAGVADPTAAAIAVAAAAAGVRLPVMPGSRSAVDAALMPMLLAPGSPYMLTTRLHDSAPAGQHPSHWSSQLHTLISQLQWDIGVQRHRRRRQHAQAAAARAQAAAEQAATAARPGSAAPSTPTAAARDASSSRSRRGAAAAAGAAPAATSPPAESSPGGFTPLHGSSTPTPPAALMHALSSRRGDALQDVLVAPDSPTAAAAAAAASSSAAAAGAPDAPGGGASLPGAMPTAAGSSQAGQAPAAVAAAHRVRRNSMTSSISRAGSIELEDDAGAEGAGAGTPGHTALPTLSPASTASRSRAATAAADIRSSRGRASSRVASGDAGERSSKAVAIFTKAAGSEAGGNGAEALSTINGDAANNGEGEGDSAYDDDNSSLSSGDELTVCSICMDMPVAVQVASCHHGLCVQCAFQLTVKGRELPSCPFCRQKISGFEPRLPQVSSPSASPAGLQRQ